MTLGLTDKYIEHPLIKERTVEARLYQQLVYAKAVKANTLFVAPTALGKTVLCVMVAAHRLQREGGRIMVLAPTRPLVLQHAGSFRRFLALPEESILDFSGMVCPEEREGRWPLATIAIATPQVVENDLSSGRLQMGPYTLVVFDEAHRSVGSYAYVPIARAYRESNPKGLILGLTASPGNSEDVVREVCENLGVVNIEVRGDDDPDVRPYINPVEMDWRMLPIPKALREAAAPMQDYLDTRFRDLQNAGLIRSQHPTRRDIIEAGRILSIGPERFSERFGKPPYLFYKCLMDYATGLKAEHALEVLETQGVSQTLTYLERMSQGSGVTGSPRSTRAFVRDSQVGQFVSCLRRLADAGIEHPKIAQVQEIVSEELSRNPQSRVIIFTNFRDTVDLIVERLSQRPGMKVTGFVGQSSRRSRGLTQREQGAILDLFRRGGYNILVATSVAEEGLDIAEVQMVVFYDCTASAIRNIQRRGRTGRRGAGKVVVLIAEATREEAYHWAGQSRERRMRSYLRNLDTDLKKRQLKLDGFVRGA